MSIPVLDRVRTLLCQIGKEGVLSNWKFSLLANVLLLAVLPQDRSNSVEILNHFFDLSVCSMPLLRKIAVRGIYALIRPILAQDNALDTPLAQLVSEKSFSKLTVRQVRDKVRDGTFVKRFLQLLIDDRETTDIHGDRRAQSRQSGNNSGSFEASLANESQFLVDRHSLTHFWLLSGFGIFRFDRWPDGVLNPAIADGRFLPHHASAIQVLNH